MKTLSNIPSLSGKTVFLRADFNVPVSNGKVIDDFRIKKTFASIDFLREKGASIIITSHFEGEGGSLFPVAEYLKEKYPLAFVSDYFPDNNPQIKTALDQGLIVLLENIRKYDGEKNNNEAFARYLASFADFYVNEAFASSHRNHASIIGIPRFIPGFAGFVFEEEVRELSRMFNPTHPFMFVLGGAKFETKLPLIKKFFTLADHVFIGGALANDFLKAQGSPTGKSLLSSSSSDIQQFLGTKLILPRDVWVKNENSIEHKDIKNILPDDCIVDVGPETMKLVAETISGSKSILWNGPLGNYELGFKEATLSLAQSIAQREILSVVGGGDTIASIAELNLLEKFSFISTGGGAMLDFLAHETLPGIDAINKSA